MGSSWVMTAFVATCFIPGIAWAVMTRTVRAQLDRYPAETFEGQVVRGLFVLNLGLATCASFALPLVALVLLFAMGTFHAVTP